MTFNHEGLKVYQRTVSFNAKVGTWIGQWDARHAIRDHLPRAAGSMLENIAIASAAHSAMKRRNLDYAIGSSLECAACLDLAKIKRLLEAGEVCAEKEELSQILRMLVGLRKTWARMSQRVGEGTAGYGETSAGMGKVCEKNSRGDVLFRHETLEVYQVALAVAEAFYASEAVSLLSNQVFRRLDELIAGMVLNIAEGNGRFSDADQVRFLATTHESAVKLAARLDLCVTQNLLSRDEVDGWKALLERVSAMSAMMNAFAKPTA